MLLYRVIFVGVVINCAWCYTEWSAYDCGPHDVWDVDETDNDQMMATFQNFLSAWQRSCEKNHYTTIAASMGFAGSLQDAGKHFITAIETGSIYRPSGDLHQHHWLYAEENSHECSLRMKSVDCFFEPLTACGFSNHVNYAISDYDANALSADESSIALQFSGTTDVCGLATKAKKPVLWVMGQMLHYLMRPNKRTKEVIDERMKQVFDQLGEGETSIGVYLHGDNPSDLAGARYWDQEKIDMNYVLAAVDAEVEAQKAKGKTVGLVYLCSDHNSLILESTEKLNEKYPRPFKYVMLPHISFAPDYSDSQQIVDVLVVKHQTHSDEPRIRPLVEEYLADIEILTKTDVLIGSFSKFYSIAAALRIARNFGNTDYRANTCHFDDSMHDLICEDTPDAKGLWRHFFGGFASGVPF